ncbi:unnamed protein product [Pieris macdunnoughi]|uniref:Uncharacterized protein n=1 Tax=Pieris macdunnoughi TaxID=345717 RepID=A0A821SAE9_9NEOP|nr:unnamed protein product [Pieris macdunnoughi]
MNCLTPKSKRRNNDESRIPSYYSVQPPYNPEFMYENYESKTSYYFPGGLRYTVQHSLNYDEETDGRGRSLYEGVNWQPVSAQVLLLVCIAPHDTCA